MGSFNGQPPVSYIVDFIFFPPIQYSYICRHISSFDLQQRSSTSRLAGYMVPISLLFPSLPLLALTSRPSALTYSPSVERAIVVEPWSFFLDYATHEVPLPLFGLGHDWACTFRGAPLPLCGQA